MRQVMKKICAGLLVLPVHVYIILLSTSCVKYVDVVKEGQAIELVERNGYLLIAIDTNSNLKKIDIAGFVSLELTHKNLHEGENYILTPVHSGKYRFKRIDMNSYQYLPLKKGDWSFEVKENTVTYVGHLTIEQTQSIFGDVYVELENRSSQAAEFMEKKFPEILRNYRMTYSGPGDDLFLDYLYNEKERISNEN